MCPCETPIPSGMEEVTKDEFFARLKADGRDIMPNHDAPDFTIWKTRARQVWGWSTPGWKTPGTQKRYAVKS